MKKILLLTLMLLLVFGISATSSADLIDDSLKWSQLPDLENGYDIPSYFINDSIILVADDWQCTDGNLPVTDIHWWGSYSGCGSHDGQIDNFFIGIYLDMPDDILHPEEGGYPGSFGLDWAYYFSISEVNETPYGETDSIFQYYLRLDEDEYFDQDEGEIYWIAIAAVLNHEATQTWGWSTTSPNNNWRNDAVQHEGDFNWEELYYPLGHEYEGQSINMAFELTTVPEPGTMVLLGSLATGLFGAAGIRRRFTKH